MFVDLSFAPFITMAWVGVFFGGWFVCLFEFWLGFLVGFFLFVCLFEWLVFFFLNWVVGEKQ